MTADQSTKELPTLCGSLPELREWVQTCTIGICMGSADAVPGVSGGTIALIAGIYGRLIDMITASHQSAYGIYSLHCFHTMAAYQSGKHWPFGRTSTAGLAFHWQLVSSPP
ncbi:hypothetical protein GCM10009000_084970 [Halobacterium noricense]|uniref:DUF368 domain-containing protein n=1 Tax=Haladaptatus pallidirubidus TaxID=1008152 RepID=A0AAV3US84_9EURY